MRPAWAVGAFFALLSVAWLFGNPPGAAPDEPDHYVRALAVGEGDWLGQATELSSMRPVSPLSAVYLRLTNRLVRVPAGMAAPPSWFCTQDHDTNGACLGDQRAPATTLQTTYEGTYLPFAYVPSGLLMRLASTPPAGLLLGRAAIVLLCLPLLLAAVTALHQAGSPLSLLGILVAATPAVVYVGTVLNPSGPEIASSICLAACLIRLWRQGGGGAWLWTGIGVSGFLLAVSRPLGVVWLLAQLGVFAAMAGWRPLRSAGRRGGAAAAAIALGVALNLGWQALYQPHPVASAATVISLLPRALTSLPEVVGEAVGVFGWQNTLMPRPLYLLGAGLLFLPFVVAVFRGIRRELNVLDALVVAVVVGSVAVAAAVQLPTGFDVQGRHMLPLIVLLPLYAGEVINRHRRSLRASGARRLLLAVAGAAALMQVAGWYSNAHRWAVGPDGDWLFPLRGGWSPWLGWFPWLALVLAGAALMLVAVARATRDPTVT